MPELALTCERFTHEWGHRILVQVPLPHVDAVLDAVLGCCDLRYGDYDSVSFQTAEGIQRFRSLPGGRNRPTDHVVQVPCVEISFFVPDHGGDLLTVLRAIYDVHPYEEPVVNIVKCARTRHIRGLDEDNPNRFWNRKAESWIPEPHRG